MRPLVLAALLLAAAPARAADTEPDLQEALDTAAAAGAEPSAAAPSAEHAQSPRSSLAQASSVKVKIADAGRSTSPLSVAISAQSAPPPMGLPPFNVEEHKQLDLLTTLNQIDAARFQRRERALNEEKDEAAARNALTSEKRKQTLSPLEDELKTEETRNKLLEEKRKGELAELAAQRDRLKAENEIAKEKLQSDEIKADDAKLKIETALRELDYEDRKLKYDAAAVEHKTVALKTDLELRDKKEVWKKEANRDPEYPLEPYKDGVLTVSDRRITLDGPIVSGVADFVTERIHYFNNKDEKLPIFIVINKSPGGSVMEGYRIVKAIRASKAPVHVVVKSFAASMAAVITTLAPHSYAYPNAIILHHQLWGFAIGNPTELKDQVRYMDEWYKRLAEPVARKMGLSLDAFTKQMYKNNADGDWEEFADRARELHWVDHVIDEVRETGMTKEPGLPEKPVAYLIKAVHEDVDAQGKAFVKLPRLDPGDAYWIHNPDHYYR